MGRRAKSSTEASDHDSASKPMDVHVGGRVRLRRTLLGLSQEKLGEALGLTFQQVQKYERGANRISASRLHDLSRILDVPISFFFDGFEENTAPAAIEGALPSELEQIGRRETLELVRYYYTMPEGLRRQVYKMVKACAEETRPLAA